MKKSDIATFAALARAAALWALVSSPCARALSTWPITAWTITPPAAWLAPVRTLTAIAPTTAACTVAVSVLRIGDEHVARHARFGALATVCATRIAAPLAVGQARPVATRSRWACARARTRRLGGRARAGGQGGSFGGGFWRHVDVHRACSAHTTELPIVV